MSPSLRSAVIAEWRGLPGRKTQIDRWKSPSELVPKLMQRLGLRERLHETEVIEAWSKIVGEFITEVDDSSNETRSFWAAAPGTMVVSQSRNDPDWAIRELDTLFSVFAPKDAQRIISLQKG
jgi:hypothetical protein